MKQIVKSILYLGCLLILALQGCVSESTEEVTTALAATKQITKTSPIAITDASTRIAQASTITTSTTPFLTTTPTYIAPTVPTLNSADAKQLLDRMLSQNGGCELPCWWGIYPSETRWTDARAMLNSFVERIEEQIFTEQGADGNTHTTILAYVYFVRGIPSPEFSLETPGYFAIESVDGIVDSVLAYQDTASRFNLSDLLAEYGQPSEVYINTTSTSPTGKVPFSLVVYYAEKGILAFYHDNAPIVGDNIHFCTREKAPINLEAWFPSPITRQKVKEEFIAALDYWIFDTGLYPIQDVSNLTVDQFYLNFRDNNNTSCIVTLANKWINTNMFYIPTSTPLPTSP